ncbi:unnamed protein product [Cuscuta campestris]|uniref:Reverse transcriptase domain-containing protein n=1 Tax=Cuscuta campestris TaxID=132261 RepID=A0A484LQ01_9ASTE|nr:unnamed protein product [Cuscuta campestris]
MFHFYQGLLVSSKKELDHSSKVGSFLDMTPEENEELVEKLTSNAKYWYEDRVPQQEAGMYEVDTFTALKASMESLIKRTIQDQFSASSHPNKQHESIAQADAYYQGGSSSHQNELVLSCESCTGAHLTSQCPYNESTTKERPREVHLAQYANKGEGPWAPNQYQPAYQRNDPSRERNNNNFQRNNRSRDDYKQGGWNNNTNWNSQRGVKKKNDDQAFKKFLDIMGQVEVKLPLIDVLTEMLKYAKFIKDLLMHKKDLEGVSMINLNARCSALLLQQLPEKCKDPDPTEFCHFVKILKDKGSVETLLGLEAVLKEEENEGIKCVDVREVETKGSDTLELKPLPKHLEYAFLDDEGKSPVVIASELTVDQKAELLTVLRRHKQAIDWKLEDIQGISPAFCTHKIAIVEGFKPVVQTQPGVWADVEASIRPSGWERLLSLRAEASLPLTIEFLCSLRPLLGFERRDDVGIAMRHDSRLIFTLLGQRHTLTVAELGWRLGLYTQEEISHSSFADLPIAVPEDFDVQAFWTAHARTDAPFEHQLSRASDWAEPSWRFLTFLMSMSYFGRPSNSNRVYASDMLFFWSIAHQRQVNLAVFIARFLWSQTYGTRITVVCGPLITLLHRSLQVHMPILNLLLLEHSVRLLDSTMIQHIRLQRGQIRRIRPRKGPSPRPRPAPQPQSTFQQGHSSTWVENLQIPLC